MIKATVLTVALLMGGCAVTPEGQSVDKAQMADVLSTSVALATGASEANPLGLALVPLKVMVGPVVDKYPCYTRRQAEQAINSVTWGAVANNLVVAAGASFGPVAGVAVGITYWLTYEREERCD
jgi:hypothetical protein